MARIRSIKPEFFTSETLHRVEKDTRLTFIGLWTYVDDNGVGVDNPRLITAALFPLEEDVAAERDGVIADLSDLERVGVIQRYTADGKALFFVTNWDEHQKISHPSKPRYHRPAPGPGNPPGPHPAIVRRSPETLRRISGATPATLPGAENDPESGPSNPGEPLPGPNAAASEVTAGQTGLRKPSGESPATLRPEQGAGSREQGARNRELGDDSVVVSATATPPPDPAPNRPDVERVCIHLADRIEANGSKRPTIGKRWRTAARLMLDADGRTEDDIHVAIDWCQDSEFWRGNILSLPTLREKYDRMRLQARRKTGAGGRGGVADRIAEGLERDARMRAEDAADAARGGPPPAADIFGVLLPGRTT